MPRWDITASQVAADSFWDSKGDLAVGSGADASVNLSVGCTDGHVLQICSCEASGLKWDSAPAPTGNIDNGTSNITSGGIWSVDVDSGATINSSGGGVGVAGSLVLGAGNDAGLYVSGDDLYVENKTSDNDLVFRINDGGTFTEVARIVGSVSALRIAEISTPAQPAGGAGGYLYAKCDGKPYWRSNEIAEVALDGGGGAVTQINCFTANELVTVGATTTQLCGEANLTFTGSLLTLAGNLELTNTDGATKFIRTTSCTTGMYAPFVITPTSTGNAANTFGSGIQFNIADCSVGATRLGVFGIERYGADNSGRYIFSVDNAGSQTTVMTIDNTGAVSMPLQPAFYAQGVAATNVTGDTNVHPIVFSQRFDQNGDFTCNTTFTAPVGGRYFLSASATFSGITAEMTSGTFVIHIANLVQRHHVHTFNAFDGATQGVYSQNLALIADMDNGDTATVSMQIQNGASDSADLQAGSTWFGGFLVA